MKTGQNEELLRYYKNELTFLRTMGGEFARQYPRVAHRLELGRDECADPHVERLIESFAFLTARLQRDLEGELPEITTALLGVLYPQLINPIPPMAVARFEMDPALHESPSGFTVPRHTPLFAETMQAAPGSRAARSAAPQHAPLSADTTQGHVCRFRTCYPVTLWPLEVAEAAFEDAARFDFLDSSNVAAVLRLKLCSKAGPLSELELDRLRFYISGDPALVNTLYETVFCHVRSVAVLHEGEARPEYGLPPVSVLPVGFGSDEEVLPYPAQAHPGYRLIQEYFAFPEKYHFFDLANLRPHLSRGRSLDVLFLLNREPHPQTAAHADNFRLGCTPVINLFPKTTEPIRLDHRTLEYRLVADKRRERTTEIHSILSVSASSHADDRTLRLKPFYSYNHAMDGDEHERRAFWHARRAPSLNKDVAGSEMFLSFLDLDFRPADHPPAQTVYAHTLCTNRELAAELPGDERARLQIEEQVPLHYITLMQKPTRPVQPPLRGETLWRLVSHLSLNHLSLSEGRGGLEALREILRLYSVAHRRSTHKQIAGIVSLSCEKVMAQAGPDPWRGFCRGTRVTVEFDEDEYSGGDAFLLGAVLERFFALYASINSFTQLRIKSLQREGVWKQWPPTVGEKTLL